MKKLATGLAVIVAAYMGCRSTTTLQSVSQVAMPHQGLFEELLVTQSIKGNRQPIERITVDYANYQMMVSYSANPREANEIRLVRQSTPRKRACFLEEKNLTDRVTPHDPRFYQLEREFNERFELWRKSYPSNKQDF